MSVITIQESEIDALAPMPVSVTRLAGLMADPDSSMVDMAAVIEYDEALTANVLRLANSAWSGAVGNIRSVKEAMVRIGTAQILKLTVAKYLAAPLQRECAGYELHEQELWRHSVAAALAAEELSNLSDQEVSPLAFTASLMHDLGKLVLERYLTPEVVDEIQEIVHGEGITYLEAERLRLGTDHAATGGVMARYWEFPDPLVEAIERHHNPDEQPEALMDAVHMANAVAKLVGVGLGTEQMNMYVSAEAPKRLGIDGNAFEIMCAKVRFGLAEVEKLFLGEAVEV